MYYESKKGHVEKIISGYLYLSYGFVLMTTHDIPCIDGAKSYQKITKTRPKMSTLLEAHHQYSSDPFETQIATDNI